MKTFFKAVSIFGTICIGIGITSIIEYGFNFYTFALTTLSVVVAIAYNYGAKIHSTTEEIEE